MRINLLLCLMLVVGASYAQLENRLRPGELYAPGQPVYAPRFGFRSVIPQQWEGTLPRETEVFLLMPLAVGDAEIFIVGNENDSLGAVKRRWVKGLDMGDNIFLKVTGPIATRGNGITGMGTLAGSTNQNQRRIYAEAVCSSFGICITYVLVSGVQEFEAGKTALQSFVDKTTLEEPKNVSIYEGFDWTKFLSDRVLLAYKSDQSFKIENEVHLCKDGTFTSDIKRKGLVKGEIKPYQGHKKGKWSVGTGQTAVLVLEFKNGPRGEVDLRIETDDKVYVNGIRHFVAFSEKCGK